MVWKYVKKKLPMYLGVATGKIVAALAKKKLEEAIKNKDLTNLACVGIGLGLGIAQDYLLEKHIRVGEFGKMVAEFLDGIYATIFGSGVAPYIAKLVGGAAKAVAGETAAKAIETAAKVEEKVEEKIPEEELIFVPA